MTQLGLMLSRYNTVTLYQNACMCCVYIIYYIYTLNFAVVIDMSAKLFESCSQSLACMQRCIFMEASYG